MDGVVARLILVGVLVLVNAAFAGAEMALVTLRETQLTHLAERSRAGALVARLARDPNRFLATIQVGITVAGFLASATAAVSLAEPVADWLGSAGAAAEPLSVVVVTTLLAYLTLVFGELVPKRVAMQRAERWALVMARPLAALAWSTRPVVWLLSRSTDLVVLLFGLDPGERRTPVTREELRHLVAAQEELTAKQRQILDGTFEVTDRTVVEVVRPRRDVVVLDAALPVGEALEQLAASGHTRAPVGVNGSLDDVVGVVHLRDLLGPPDPPVSTVAAELVAFPETVEVLDALHRLQILRSQMALVIDEYGSGTGIITVEDLVEELVGEIYDETDRDVVAVRREPDGSLLLPGGFPVHDLVDIGVDDVPDGPYTTVAGLLLDQLGRLPDGPGDGATIGPWRLEPTELSGHAITGLRIRPADTTPRATESESADTTT